MEKLCKHKLCILYFNIEPPNFKPPLPNFKLQICKLMKRRDSLCLFMHKANFKWFFWLIAF